MGCKNEGFLRHINQEILFHKFTLVIRGKFQTYGLKILFLLCFLISVRRKIYVKLSGNVVEWIGALFTMAMILSLNQKMAALMLHLENTLRGNFPARSQNL